MKELLETLKTLGRLGASWKAQRVSKIELFDTIQCTALVRTDEGMVRGFVEVRGGETRYQTNVKMEVVCYLGGRPDDKGEFKHSRHPKNKTTKLFEYENVVLYRESKMLGISRGIRPVGAVPAEHQYLVNFAEKLIVVTDRENQAATAAKVAEESARKSANEARARRALFG